MFGLSRTVYGLSSNGSHKTARRFAVETVGSTEFVLNTLFMCTIY